MRDRNGRAANSSISAVINRLIGYSVNSIFAGPTAFSPQIDGAIIKLFLILLLPEPAFGKLKQIVHIHFPVAGKVGLTARIATSFQPAYGKLGKIQ